MSCKRDRVQVWVHKDFRDMIKQRFPKESMSKATKKFVDELYDKIIFGKKR